MTKNPQGKQKKDTFFKTKHHSEDTAQKYILNLYQNVHKLIQTYILPQLWPSFH